MCVIFSSRRRHTRWNCDWSSDVCSSDLSASLTIENTLFQTSIASVALEIAGTVTSFKHNTWDSVQTDVQFARVTTNASFVNFTHSRQATGLNLLLTGGNKLELTNSTIAFNTLQLNTSQNNILVSQNHNTTANDYRVFMSGNANLSIASATFQPISTDRVQLTNGSLYINTNTPFYNLTTT